MQVKVCVIIALIFPIKQNKRSRIISPCVNNRIHEKLIPDRYTLAF